MLPRAERGETGLLRGFDRQFITARDGRAMLTRRVALRRVSAALALCPCDGDHTGR